MGNSPYAHELPINSVISRGYGRSPFPLRAHFCVMSGRRSRGDSRKSFVRAYPFSGSISQSGPSVSDHLLSFAETTASLETGRCSTICSLVIWGYQRDGIGRRIATAILAVRRRCGFDPLPLALTTRKCLSSGQAQSLIADVTFRCTIVSMWRCRPLKA